MAGFFAQVLGVNGMQYQCDDSFFEVGGDSALVPQLLSRLRAAAPVAVAELQFADVVAAPTVAGLAKHLSAPSTVSAGSRTTESASEGGRQGLCLAGTRTRTRTVPDHNRQHAHQWYRDDGYCGAPAEKRPRLYESKQLTAVESSTGPLLHGAWLAALDGTGGWVSAASDWFAPEATREGRAEQQWPLDRRMELSHVWAANLGQCVDGAAVWVLPNTPRRQPSASEPAVVAQGLAVAASHAGVVSAVLVANGQILWRTQLSGRVEASVCIVRRPTLGTWQVLAVVGCYDSNIHFLDIATGVVVWTFKAQGEVKCAAAADMALPGLVWIGTHGSECLCLDVRTLPGSIVGRVRTGSSITARPWIVPVGCGIRSGTGKQIEDVAASTTALIASHDGRVRCVSFTLSRQSESDGTCCWISEPFMQDNGKAVPIFAGVVCAPCLPQPHEKRHSSEVVTWLAIAATVTGVVGGFDVASGRLLWHVNCSASVPGSGGVSFFSTPTAVEFNGRGYLLCPSRTGHLLCLRCADGSEVWRHRITESPLTSLALAPQNTANNPHYLSDGRPETARLASIGSADGTIVLVEFSPDGFSVVDRLSLREPVFCPPLMTRERLLVGARDDCLHCCVIE
eukprot:COSAG05_NODE_1615_length_4399_cov_1.770000_2_plen_624_part_00